MRTKQDKRKNPAAAVVADGAAADPRPKFVELLAKALPKHGATDRHFWCWLRRNAPLEAKNFMAWLAGVSDPFAAFAALREEALELAGEAVRAATPPPRTPAQGCRPVAGWNSWEMRFKPAELFDSLREYADGRKRSAIPLTPLEMEKYRLQRSVPSAPVLSRVPAMFAVMAAVAGPLKLSGKTIAVMAEQLAKPEVAHEVFAQAAVLVALDTVHGKGAA